MRKLPTYQQLSKEQDEVYHLPLQNSYLVVGPPGTGKTVMAIYRAEQFKERPGTRAQFLIYGVPLSQYMEQTINQRGVNGFSNTFHSWFGKWYWRNFRRYVPNVNGQRFDIDWPQVFRDMGARQQHDRYDHLIVDEGQDFPREFYLVMRTLTGTITVFADENQRITERNSTQEQIRLHLGVQEARKLTKNYRNSRPIAEFARHFYVGLPSGIPELPIRRGAKPRAAQFASLEGQVDFIAQYERNNSDKDIGVLVQQKNDLRSIYRLLHGKISKPAQMYLSDEPQYRSMDFERPGIKLLTHVSAKGLEFDTVFLPALDRMRFSPGDDHARMQMYVLSSRARDDLYLLYSGYDLPPVLQEIPGALYDRQAMRQRSPA